MSFDAIRWALDQQVKAATKLVLVVMAECVNTEADNMLCWPSYKHLSDRTGCDRKTVEAAVHRLKEQKLIADTGMKRGATGKVVVYRLNIPKNGFVSHAPQANEWPAGGNGNDTEIGAVKASGNHPEIPTNPPKTPIQSPQISHVTTPKTGCGTRNGTKKGTRKESGSEITSIPDVAPEVFSDWMAARKQKPVTQSALNRLEREATKAGLTVAEAVTVCAELEWRGFDATWYADRMAKKQPRPASTFTNKHSAAAAGIFGRPQQPGDIIDV